jgi:glycosyltransferase involved in cell wall biosynthesis
VTDTPRPLAFSVCIPTYNGAVYLPEAIDSVLAQTFEDFELVVCDDASTDSTPELVQSYDDPRLRYLRFDQNLGQSGNFNRCIEEARGELWTMLSADDRFRPSFLEHAFDALGRHPDAGFFVSAYERIDEDGSPLGVKRVWPSEHVAKSAGFLEDLLHGATFHTLGLVVRRPKLAQVGEFKTDVRWAHDWDWVLRLVAQEGGVYSPETLTDYREHGESGTVEALRAGVNGAAELDILREALARSRAQVDEGMRRSALRAFAIRQLYFAEIAAESGSGAAALTTLRHAVRASPWIATRASFWRVLGRGLLARSGSSTPH